MVIYTVTRPNKRIKDPSERNKQQDKTISIQHIYFPTIQSSPMLKNKCLHEVTHDQSLVCSGTRRGTCGAGCSHSSAGCTLGQQPVL